ncbi:thiamine pyrophosphate-binding protein [Roseomonas sp. E05]|uniref:thiamine pyrophosphate-binding protein n=1 Tax=Roseomonas sp. E05 TaxID=3046310 RepID=UPI0024B9FF46|nr:thiamine pyrophosphate-binding protein [Roseomonas sp. E05]MDJ0391261.1 thiamine pyrophosphate-binding protein [Roseomonas sp. E05]
MGNVKTAAEVLLDSLAARGADRAFCVPGESYIALLDALHAHPSVDLVTCRQEGGAGFMAVADAKLTGRPGIVLVSRGPGACNAAIALHTAEQDAVPLILLIGQVEKRDLRRRAFQEIDYAAMFGGIAKWVGEATHPDEVPELIARAWAMATQGVPGPVVLALPEDVLAAPCATPALPPNRLAGAGLPAETSAELAALLRRAERPILLAGHGLDVPGGREALRAFAEAWQLPVAVSFRRQDLFPNDHPLYAGDLGLRNPDAQRDAFAEADLVLALGTRLTDITTQGYSWPAPGQRLVHVCADPRFLGWLFPAELAIAAEACAVLAGLSAEHAAAPPDRETWNRRLRQLQEADSRAMAADFPDGLHFLRVARLVGECAPADAIVTLDAGTFAAPFYRKLAWKPPQRLLAPISGAMGFGVPAAVAAALRHPERTVICAVGDGGALMTGNELAVGMARRLPIKLLLSDNGSYASIRIHQERQHPGRVSGTDLANPDLGAWCAAFGAPMLRVEREADLPALAAALRAPGPLVAVVRTSLQAVLPGTLCVPQPAPD